MRRDFVRCEVSFLGIELIEEILAVILDTSFLKGNFWVLRTFWASGWLVVLPFEALSNLGFPLPSAYAAYPPYALL